MWSAFGNGSSGFASKAEGWEFVPCSSSEGGCKKVQSPRVRSFPSNLLEQLPPGPAAATDATPYSELQSQHTRLKKRFEELKKRHDLEREVWRMEKETLLRQFADIQGGENRRILLDMKSVLEEVQFEVKREESKRSELELRYIKDRCAWQLERAGLMSRITQLEVRGCSVPVETIRRPEQRDTLKREREEQKRLLADTHSAAMDLRCRLENSEKGWVKEKSELLERFDSERKEWENQLMDMQRKIEELYDEVKAQCKGGPVKPVTDLQSNALRISSCSLSSDAQSNEYSEVLTLQSNTSIASPNQPDHNSSESYNQCNSDQNELLNLQGAEKYELGEQQAIDTAELEEILESCLKLKRSNKSCFIGQDDLLNPFQGFQSMDINCGSYKKKNTALNAALKEIARVSEELCSYQDEMRKWPDFKRSCTESVYFPGKDEMVEKVKDSLEMADTALDLKNLSEELKSLDEQYWMNWEGFKQQGQTTQNDAKPLANKGQCAPPIPARSTSWYLSSPSLLESSGTKTLSDREFQRPGFHQDRKFNSPAIVLKFEAMLQENEGKILMDSGNLTCTVPVESKCNISCCPSRWSCDGNTFGSIKSSKYAPVKKCLSNIDIATTPRECNPVDAEEKNDPKASSHPMNLDHMSTDPVISLDIVSPYSNFTANRRNERLEKKTAEFNRTLFQTGMGHRCDEENLLNVSIDCELASTAGLTFFKSKGNVSVEDKKKGIMAQCPEDQFLEMNPHTRPQLKSETKDFVSMSSSLQQDVDITELPSGSSDQASKDLSSLKADFIYSTKHSKEVKPSWTEHSTAMPVVPFGPSVGEKCFELSVTPLQTQIQIESFSRNMEVGTDQPSKQPKKAKQDTRSRILEDNPWKPSTLAAYPRPVESRSNYGAVERILKSYEDQNRSQDKQQSQPSPGKEKDLMDLLEMLDIRDEPRSSQRLTHTPHQVIAHKETHQGKESSVTFKKSFSRPACPAKRRLPSRWASRSSTSSASTPSPPPTIPPTVFTQQQTLTYSTYHTETVI
ncbi:protein SOGA3a isoform X2 [Triplophysa rosa]|uniref:protein SOGA3a isoform X2 n=1 Tax=Triplophysa rosa TaxID=992332 RepID=UPI002545D61A|nr:protein SOGA3a isoform X2 [Triplophysa rosa]